MDAAGRRGMPAGWLIRANHTRKTPVGDKRWDRLVRRDPLGAIEFTVPAAPDRPACLVRQPRYRQAITVPARPGAPRVTVPARLAREEDPPVGEKALEWRLLTTRPAEPLDTVVDLINWYRRRWLVEIVCSIWNSGGRVEALQVGPWGRLEQPLVSYLIPFRYWIRLQKYL